MLEILLYGAHDVTVSSPPGCIYSLRHVRRYKAYSHTELMTGLGVKQICGCLRCDVSLLLLTCGICPEAIPNTIDSGEQL